jgi:hypothetical protein
MYMIMLLLKKNCRDFFSFYNITLNEEPKRNLRFNDNMFCELI